MIRIGINGFGRIGRALLRASWNDSEVEVVAINDLGDIENLGYLLRHDSVYRNFPAEVKVEGADLVVGGKKIKFLQEKDPAKLPWKDLQIDVAVESTGVFDSFEKASAHITAGARHAVISAPVKDDLPAQAGMPNSATVLVGVNEEKLSTCSVTSNASCTTNAASPLIAILDETLGIEKALLNTTHAYTATQSMVDSPVKGSDYRRGRAGASNMSPSTTGAAIAVTKAYEQLAGKFDGIAVRVPVIAGSLADITFVSKRDTTVEEVNKILEEASQEVRWQGIFAVTKEPLVSSDIIGSQYGSIADLALTKVVGGNLVKVLAWYDNEMGYAHTLLRHVKAAGKHSI
ncbi:type I glyceraldehyde-3-phosphate dehydrogenase [Acetobacteraceae bacterium]|nr:type I glyceraldehyde-3-phosphate dehydrogenase [Candidatus Parcubacteria bacterium]